MTGAAEPFSDYAKLTNRILYCYTRKVKQHVSCFTSFINKSKAVMLIIALIRGVALAMKDLHDQKFQESQLKRIEAIAALKEAGLALIQIRELFATATPNSEGLIETDDGNFKSFKAYLKSGALAFSSRSAYNYIKLADNWDIILDLGMQDPHNADKCMRLCRTLKVIDWYNRKLEEGWEPEYLTLDLYWSEDNAPNGYESRPNYKNLYEEAQATIARLEAELNRYRLEALV